MNRNYYKKIRRALFIRRLIVLILIILTIYFVHLLHHQNKVKADLEREIITYTKEIENLNENIKVLERDYERKDSLEYIEKIAREKLGMVKANELIIIDENMQQDVEEENR